MLDKSVLLNELKSQILKTIPLLKKELTKVNNQNILKFLNMYENSLQKLNNIDFKKLSMRDFKSISSCTRLYIESNSRWDQPFMHQMGRVEEIIDKLYVNFGL